MSLEASAAVVLTGLLAYLWFVSKVWPWSRFRRCPRCGCVLAYRSWRQRYCPRDGAFD